ncbi:MAG TPA: hotdog domain-containing protein, partial [Ilumatobacteraceae bacterium]|nr:hotdog domain-containing protein [Ilumatobacteraceae bacterium]
SGADIVQGSFVTLLGEAAALAFAEHELAAAVTVRSLEVGYLAPVAADTVTTRARWLGRRGAADIDVVACDVETGRVCATFVVGVTTV